MIKRAHLRQFMSVVDTGNFTRAAERLGLTQPTLSAGIAELERLAGTRLFLREKRRVQLTDAGNRLVAHARAIEREFRMAEAGLSEAKAPASPLLLGVLPSLPTAGLAAMARQWRGARPLALVEGGDADLRRRLAAGQIAAALTLLGAGDAERGAAVLLDEPYAMLLPAAHARAGAGTIEPRDVAGETMIARRSCELLAETSRFFTRHGVRPPFVLRSANDDRCLELVRAGAGITTAPLSLVRPGVVAVAIAGYDFRRTVGLVAGQAISAADRSALEQAARAAIAPPC